MAAVVLSTGCGSRSLGPLPSMVVCNCYIDYGLPVVEVGLADRNRRLGLPRPSDRRGLEGRDQGSGNVRDNVKDKGQWKLKERRSRTGAIASASRGEPRVGVAARRGARRAAGAGCAGPACRRFDAEIQRPPANLTPWCHARGGVCPHRGLDLRRLNGWSWSGRWSGRR